jgi:hypothetical protein
MIDGSRSRLKKKRRNDKFKLISIKEKQEGKRSLGRLRLRCEDCVKIEVKAVDPGANWREVAEDRIS